jgi:hypothetical protein
MLCVEHVVAFLLLKEAFDPPRNFKSQILRLLLLGNRETELDVFWCPIVCPPPLNLEKNVGSAGSKY